jgi:hypothetical protein
LFGDILSVLRRTNDFFTHGPLLLSLYFFVQSRRFTEPWMHVICTLGGAWVANKWVMVEKDLLADVNEIRAHKGLPPMVGSHYFFPFVPPNLGIEGSKK